MAKVIALKRTPPRTYDAREKLIDQVREEIFKHKFEALALKAGCSKTTVSRLAQGYTKWPRPETLFGLLEALGLRLTIGRAS